MHCIKIKYIKLVNGSDRMTFARGIQRNINIVVLFQLKLLPCRWIYIIDYLCVSLLMQCVHFKGTKCVFDRRNAETTCSKWPELQITQEPYANCSDWPCRLKERRHNSAEHHWLAHPKQEKHFAILFSHQSPNGAKECCCCMFICTKISLVSQNIGSRTLPYVSLSAYSVRISSLSTKWFPSEGLV